MKVGQGKRKILFVIPSMAGGGAERIVQLVVNNLSTERYEIKIAVFEDAPISYALREDIEVICLHKKNMYDLPRTIWRLLQLIRNYIPTVVISFLTYANYISIIAHKLSGSAARLVISEHNNTSEALRHERFCLIKTYLIRLLYPSAHRIIAVSRGCLEDLIKNFGVPKDKVKVIYNPVALDEINRIKNEEPAHSWYRDKTVPILISVSRLTEQKGLIYLIKALRLVNEKIKCRLIITGEGEDRIKLEKEALDLGIGNRVSFIGFQPNPFSFIKHADIFVFPSLWEGFGNVIIEAMACGTPVVSSDCHYGPSEIISDRVNGFLVTPGNENALADAIKVLLIEENTRKQFIEKGLVRAKDFCAEDVTKEYEKVFDGK
jgi:glycosyltransferase involved in cell wall biosynthesis